jgi:hypothetical protein
MGGKAEVPDGACSSDTVSAEEYGSSSEGPSEKSEKKPSYSHSRFSSNMGDLDELLLQSGDIDMANLAIDDPASKKLINDKR